MTIRYGQVAYTSEASTKIPDKLEEHSTFLIHPPTDSSVTDVRGKIMLSVVVAIPFECQPKIQYQLCRSLASEDLNCAE